MADRERTLHFTPATLNDFLFSAFPDATRDRIGEVVLVERDLARMRLVPGEGHTRPGNIVSGPTLMALADVAAYAVILAHAGPVAMAVTSSLTMHFLRGCKVDPIHADAHLLKLGRRMAVVDVRIWQGSAERVVAQASVSYALP